MVCWYIDFHIGFIILPYEGTLFALLPFLYLTGLRTKVIGNLFVLIGFSFGLVLVFHSGGMYSPVMPWLTLMPICGLLFVDKYSAFGWAFIALITTLYMAYYWNNYGDFPFDFNFINKGKVIYYYTSCFSGLIFIYLGLNLIFEYALQKANILLEKRNIELMTEKEKSEKLLLNILPEEVARELKENGTAEARQFDEVSVLFTDFVQFTQTAETLSPHELVNELNECFTAFDYIIEQHGLEKIKTVGDAYLAVCGLPSSNPEHAMKTVRAALAIKEFIDDRIKQGKIFEIRIGIHSGSVVAGIVGIKKFAYDIWGDTVNTAARMEQSGEAGKVNISGATHRLVKDGFVCTYRGKITAKNKGEMEMYFVNNKGASL
ncbi:MAG: adenylate/guanylate cyclase domain-containing protein [Sphingobacteriales bacterium]|nr:adenylate/guanylate cyclase domain-containing protein [Sphingobacteriales bacterium]